MLWTMSQPENMLIKDVFKIKSLSFSLVRLDPKDTFKLSFHTSLRVMEVKMILFKKDKFRIVP